MAMRSMNPALVVQSAPGGLKRSYPYQSQSPMHQMPISQAGTGGYYAATSGGTPRFVIRSSAAQQSGNVTMVLPQAQQQAPLHMVLFLGFLMTSQIIQVQATTPAGSGPVRTSVGYTSPSSRQMPQQPPSTIQIMQQQKGEPTNIQHATILQQHGPDGTNPQQQMTVREYLTGGSKRLRLE